MDIKDIRLENLEKLISKEISATVFANKIDMSPSQLSQVRNPKYSRSVGNAMARKVEKILSLSHGWMDRLHDEPAETEKTSPIVNNQNSYTSSKTADQVIKEIINSVNSGRLSDEDVVLLGAMAKKIQRAPEPIDYSTHYPGLIDEDT